MRFSNALRAVPVLLVVLVGCGSGGDMAGPSLELVPLKTESQPTKKAVVEYDTADFSDRCCVGTYLLDQFQDFRGRERPRTAPSLFKTGQQHENKLMDSGDLKAGRIALERFEQSFLLSPSNDVMQTALLLKARIHLVLGNVDCAYVEIVRLRSNKDLAAKFEEEIEFLLGEIRQDPNFQ